MSVGIPGGEDMLELDCDAVDVEVEREGKSKRCVCKIEK